MVSPSPTRILRASSNAIPDVLGQPALVPIKLSGSEGLNTLFTYELQLAAPDSLPQSLFRAANFTLGEFLCRELTVHIQRDDGSSRDISGLITSAKLLDQSSRFVHYQLRLQPWLYLASLNSDCRVYQDKTVVEIIEALLSPYHFPIDKRLIETYPKRDYQTQFNESDHHFFCRLCEQWGINWFFEHSHGKHRLILIDSMSAYRENPACPRLTFHPERPRSDADALHNFIPAKQLTTGTYSTKDFDYTRPKADLTVTRSDPGDTAHSQSERYQWHTDAHYSQPQAGNDTTPNDAQQEAEFLARLRLESLRQSGWQATGSGALRAMMPGCTFRLEHHPQDAANIDYLITSASLLIEDSALASESLSHSPSHRLLDTSFTAHPLKEPIRPLPRTDKPIAYGPQLAHVVGPDKQQLWTDRYGRIKVQFPWDRNGKKNQNSSCWIRVAVPWAGNQLGSQHLPRIGQEVLIDFMDGNYDLPVCTGSLINPHNLPPWQLSVHSALAGLRSRELGESKRNNHLLFDDTANQMQAQLHSDHLYSQLNLGHLDRIDGNLGRQEARGEGLELRSDGAGVLRAIEGMLLSADARLQAAGDACDYDEITTELERALALAQQLDPAVFGGAAHDTQSQQALTAAVAALHEQGKSQDQPRGAPLIALSAPAGIASATPQSQLHYAGHNINTVAADNQQHYAMGELLHTATNNMHSVAHDGDISNIAHKGKVIMQTQNNSMELTADQTLTVTSVNGAIELRAKKYIFLQAGDSFIKITENDITVDARILNLQSDATIFSPVEGGEFVMPSFADGSRRSKTRNLSL